MKLNVMDRIQDVESIIAYIHKHNTYPQSEDLFIAWNELKKELLAVFRETKEAIDNFPK